MSPHHAPTHRPAAQNPFRRSPIAALATTLAFMALGPVHAQGTEPSVADLQAEITRLKQALAAAQGAATPTAPAAPAAEAGEGAAAPASTASTANAGDQEQQLETVVVRSRNRIERVQDVPLSVSVIGGRELERELALDIGAITKRAANVVRNTGNSRTYSLSIRGVGKVSQVEAQDASVGMILDGVSYAYAPLGSFDYYDVESVEVARGPQGTLLGKNTTMGVINVTTRKPSFTPDASWALTLGQRNTVIAQFAGGGPVIDDLLAFRGAVTVNKGAGPYTNAYNHDETYFNRDRVAGRVQFLLTPTPDFSARASVEIQPKSGEYYNGLTVKQQVPATYANGTTTTTGTQLDIRTKLSRDWFTNQSSYKYDTDYLGNLYPNNDNQRALQTSTNGASLELKWNLGSHDLTSITAYRDYHFHARNDSDATPFDVQLNGGGKNDAYRQRSQELRLSSKPGGFVDYQVGALWFANSVDFGKDGGWNAGWGTDAGAWFASVPQYTALNTDAAGRLLMVNSLKGLNKASTQSVRNQSIGIYGQADWHLTEQTTLTTGLRFTHENRKNSGSNYIVDNGAGGDLNPVSSTNLQLGGFSSWEFGTKASDLPAGKVVGDLKDDATTAQKKLADDLAKKYFGSTITSTPGQAYGLLTTAQKNQVAAAKAIRAGQLNTLWALAQAESFRKTQPSFVVSPTYKINDDHTTYASLQYGEKGGAVQIVEGKSYVAKPEKVTSYEVGLKSAFLDKTLFLNTALFFTNVKDYQQPVTEIIDPASNTTVNYTGNAPKVEVKGLEVDGSYTGLKNVTVRFSGAYTDAKFKEFKNSPNPAEWAYNANPSKVTDLSGEALTGAAKYTFNVGAEYRRPVFSDKVFHTSFNTAYSSKFNSDAALSSYAWIPSQWKTDFNIGLGRRDNGFDVSLIVKNLFNDDTPQVQTWNSYTPGEPRWFGIQFSGKL